MIISEDRQVGKEDKMRDVCMADLKHDCSNGKKGYHFIIEFEETLRYARFLQMVQFDDFETFKDLLKMC